MIFDEENSVNDSLKDNFNNKVGTAIAIYAVDNKLPEEMLGALVKDALDRGLLAVSRHKDPRVNWYSAITGRSYTELYDGPFSNVIAGLESTYGVVGLKSGSLSGPGTPAKDLGLTEIETTPEPKPGSFSGEARATTSPFSTPGNTTNEDAAAIFDQEGSGLSPRPKFNRKYQSGYPLSNKPLMPGAKEILPPSFTLKPQVRDIDLAPVSAPRSDNSNKNSLTGRVIPLTGNPFSLSKPNLKLQAEMIERNPVMAKRMILAEKRDPKLFGLA